MADDLARLAIWLLGSINESDKAAFALRPQITASSLVEQAKYHKVTAITLTNMQYLHPLQSTSTDMQRVAADLREDLEERRKNDVVIRDEVRELQDFCNSRNIEGYIIKGKKREAIYPSLYARHTGDVDLLVSDIETIGPIIAWLRNHGYNWDPNELPWIKRWRPGGDGRLYGQVPLLKKVPSLKRAFRYDLHFGGYSIGDSAFLPCEECLSWEGELVVLLGHALGEGLFKVKDLNDWHAIIRTQSIDWGKASRLIEQMSLMPVFQAIERLDTWQSTFQKTLQMASPGSIPIYNQRYGRSRRIARHTFAVSRRLHNSVATSLRQAALSFIYYSSKHSLQMRGEFMHSPQFEEGSVDRWNCWRLVPIRKAIKGCIAFWGTYFWPTVWYDIPDHVLSEIMV